MNSSEKASPSPLTSSASWHDRALSAIPGGTQSAAKSSYNQVHGSPPTFLVSGRGCRVTDVEGRDHIDFVQGNLTNILGYCDETVNAAVIEQLKRGQHFSLPHHLEVEVAERLILHVPCAEKVRFCKTGSEATTAAIRAARALTGRSRVAYCGAHGWHDWCVANSTLNKGVPKCLEGLATPFDYNDIASLRRALTDGTEPCAAVIMEPVRYIAPLPGYLAEVARVSREFGAILIFDEICTGFHLGLGGAQKRFGITPDLACFGKALGNGFPIACVVGRSDMMSVFTEIYTSSTFGAEAASLAAARAVMDVLSSTDALKQMYNRAKRLALTFDALCADAGLGAMFRSIGFPTRSFISIKAGNTSDVARALFRQETREERIIICGGHNFCTAHDDQAIDETILKYQAVLRRLAQWLSDKAPEAHLMRRTGHIHARE